MPLPPEVVGLEQKVMTKSSQNILQILGFMHSLVFPVIAKEMLTAFISGQKKDEGIQVQFSALFSYFQSVLHFYSLKEVLTEGVNEFTYPVCQVLQLQTAAGRLILKTLITAHNKSSTLGKLWSTEQFRLARNSAGHLVQTPAQSRADSYIVSRCSVFPVEFWKSPRMEILHTPYQTDDENHSY